MIKKDPQTGQEVARVLKIEGGAGIVSDFPASWDTDRLKKHIREQIEFYENKLSELSTDIISELAAKISGYNPDVVNVKDKLGITSEMEARLYSAIAEYYLGLGADGEFHKVMGAKWNNEKSKILDNIEGVTYAVDLIDARKGDYFRGLITRSDLENIVLPHVSSPEAATIAVKLAIRLSHITGMSAYYGGPVDEHGNLIEERIIKEVFFDKGIPIDMRNPEYWAAWDRERLKPGGLKAIPLRHNVPTGLKTAMFGPETLQEGQFGVPELRHIGETRVRPLAFFKGVNTLGQVLREPPAGVLRPESAPSRVDLIGGGDYYFWTQMVAGGAALLDKYYKAEGSLLRKGFTMPSLVFSDLSKMEVVTKPYLDLASGSDYDYLIRYTYGDPGTAAEEPMMLKAFVLHGLIKHLNTPEGQRFYNMRQRFEHGVASIIRALSFGLISEHIADTMTFAYKRWGAVEIFEALQIARFKNIFDDRTFNGLQQLFGVSRFGAGIRQAGDTLLKG